LEAAIGEVGEGSENPRCEGEILADRSEFEEGEREVIGTVRFLIFVLEDFGFQSSPRLFERGDSSGGISSGAGSGKPLTTATN
jgi:hypothetical protein